MPQEPADPRLGAALRQLRVQAGMTQEDVAYNAGITPANMSKIEIGRSNPMWTTVVRIAEALGVSLGDLGDLVESSE